jgi:hypothetical protein
MFLICVHIFSQFFIHNWQKIKSTPVFEVSADRQFVKMSDPTYNGGSKTKPGDQALRLDITPYWTYGGPLAVGMVNAVSLLFVLVTSLYIVVNRQTNAVKVRIV